MKKWEKITVTVLAVLILGVNAVTVAALWPPKEEEPLSVQAMFPAPSSVEVSRNGQELRPEADLAEELVEQNGLRRFTAECRPEYGEFGPGGSDFLAYHYEEPLALTLPVAGLERTLQVTTAWFMLDEAQQQVVILQGVHGRYVYGELESADGVVQLLRERLGPAKNEVLHPFPAQPDYIVVWLREKQHFIYPQDAEYTEILNRNGSRIDPEGLVSSPEVGYTDPSVPRIEYCYTESRLMALPVGELEVWLLRFTLTENGGTVYVGGNDGYTFAGLGDASELILWLEGTVAE